MALALSVKQTVSCEHWKDAGTYHGGICLRGEYGGKPSFGLCSVCEYQKKRKKEHRQYQELLAATIDTIPPYPKKLFSGRSIVTCAGKDYIDSAFILCSVIRHLKCDLPIEIFHLKDEIYEWHKEAFADLNVTFVDASELIKIHPAVIKHPWSLKPYAVLWSQGEEVLFLDADAYPIREDFLLFDTPEFKETGAIYFPDRCSVTDLPPHKWEAMGLEPGPIKGLESGEIFVDKKRCWKELQIAMFQCEHHKHYFNIYHGDTGAWHFAHRLLGTEYSKPSKVWEWPEGRTFGPAMIQHDFEGKPLFAHRTVSKFCLTNYIGTVESYPTGQIEDKRCDTIPFEDFCWKKLEELRKFRSKYISILQLSAIGDLLVLAPALKYLSKDHHVSLVTCDKYANLLASQYDWLNVIPFHGTEREWEKGAALAKRGGEVRISQVGWIDFERQHRNWALEIWSRTGVSTDEFANLPLELPNRDYEAEQELIDKYVEKDKPLILLNTIGKSSPYKHGDALRELLADNYANKCQILDLAFVRPNNFLDLRGLYDRAVCLISTDTSTLHLAWWNKIPTIALIRDYAPHNGWGSSEPKSNWLLSLEYEDSSTPDGLQEIKLTIDNLFHMPAAPYVPYRSLSFDNEVVEITRTRDNLTALLEVSHTSGDREIAYGSSIDFDAYTECGEWDNVTRPMPPNISMINSVNKEYPVAIASSQLFMDKLSAETPIIWKSSVAFRQYEKPIGILERVQAWVAPCKETLELFQMTGDPKGIVIEHGIDSDMFFGWRKEKANGVLTVASQINSRPEKGFAVLNEFAQQINVSLLGGDNSFEAEGITNIGYAQNFSRVGDIYRAHLVYFNPSAIVSRATLEAMATGMPVVTMKPANFIDFMRDGENCIIVENAESAIQVIGKLMNNSALMKHLGKNAREETIDRFHSSICSKKWADLCKTVAKKLA